MGDAMEKTFGHQNSKAPRSNSINGTFCDSDSSLKKEKCRHMRDRTELTSIPEWKSDWRTPFIQALNRLSSTYPGLLFLATRLSFASAAEAEAEDAGPAFGDDAANNLFSDLGPLLSLFGEQVAKQFMASSTTWEDNVLFAMGPLGVLTAVISAIRIGGPPWLRTIIGRARESRAIAEEELTTSTSQDVCEIWSGQSVVRLVGAPRILQLIYLDDDALDPEDRLLTLEDGTKAGYKLEMAESRERGFIPRIIRKLRKKLQELDSSGSHHVDVESRQPQNNQIARSEAGSNAPNLFLNLRPTLSLQKRWEQRAFALLGFILQAGVLVFVGPTNYHRDLKDRFKKEGEPVEAHAFPLTAAGTVLLVLGMWICSFVVGSSTEEQSWEVRDIQSTSALQKDPKRFRIIWLQQSGAVTDQQFDSYAIIAQRQRTSVLTSRLTTNITPTVSPQPASNDPQLIGKRQSQQPAKVQTVRHQYPCRSASPTEVDPSGALQIVTTFGTVVSVVGFVLQFTGFRSSHFSAAVAQLITTATMVVVRAYLRRDLALRPAAYRIPEGFEMEWMATRLAFEAEVLWPSEPKSSGVFKPKVLSVISRSKKRSQTTGRGCSDTCNCTAFDDTCNWGIHSGAGTDAFEFHARNPSLQRTSACHTAVRIRERIGRLSKWTGEISDLAIQLSAAIETVMNTLLMDDSQHTELDWTMQGFRVPGTSDSGKIYLSVKRQKDGWKANATEIEAVLALWLYSIRSRQVQNPKVSTDQESDWLRQNNTTSRVSALRLLGTRETDSAYIRDLRWYMGDFLKELRYLKDPDPSPSSKEPSFTVESPLIFGFEKANEVAEPIGGRSLSFCLQPLDPTQHLFELEDPTAVRDDALSDSSQTSTQVLFGLLSDTTLEKHLAQDLFSTFMWSVARRMERLEGKTTLVPSSDGEGPVETRWKSFRLQNETLSELVSAVDLVASDSLGGLNGIYWSIVPPLSELDKLPDPFAIVEHVRNVSLSFEAVGNWHQATLVHLDLFRCCRTFGVRSELRRKATAAIFNFCWVIGGLRGETESFNFDDDLLRDIKEDETALLDALSVMEKDGGDLVRNLLILYRLQNRPLLAFERRMAALGYRFDVSKCQHTFKGFPGATSLHTVALRRKLPLKLTFASHQLAFNDQDDLGLTWFHYYLLKNRTNYDSSLGLMVIEQAFRTIQKHTGGPPVRIKLKLKDLSGWSIIHYAVSKLKRSIKVLERLMEVLGWDRPVRNTDEYGLGPDLCGRTPFHYVETEDVARLLVSRGGISLNAKERDGSDALLRAVKRGLEKVATVYLDVGANPKSTDGSMRTAMHWAAYHGQMELLKYLREKGADPNARDAVAQTPYHWTGASNILSNTEFFTLFNLRSEDIDIRDSNGRTVLHIGAAAGLISNDGLSILIRHQHHTKARNDRNIIDTTDQDGNTALGHAAANGHKTIVRVLLQYSRLNINQAVASLGKPPPRWPLTLAIRNNHESILRLFLNYGMGGYNRDKMMLEAVNCGSESMVRMLFNRGASAISSDAGRTALRQAILELGNESMALLLLNRGCQFERNFAEPSAEAAVPLSLASYKGMYETVRLMLELGADVDAIGSEASSGVQFFLGFAVHVLGSGSDTQHPALYYATTAGHESTIQLLLRWGAIVNLEGKYDGKTALWQAVAKGHEKIVRLLLSRGGRLGTRKVGVSPLPEPTDKIAKLLRDSGVEFESYMKFLDSERE